MTTESTFSKNEAMGLILLALIAMTVTTVAVIPSFRNQIKEIFLSNDRLILAKVTGNIGPEGPKVTALKIQSSTGIILEIYRLEDGNASLISKNILPEKRDGYFSIQGNATNLALTDVDSDGLMELVAPTYDDQMVPRLNVFKYNNETKQFDRINAPE